MAINEISVTGIENLKKITRRLRQQVSDREFDKNLDQGVIILLDRIKKRFLNEVDTDGKPWARSQAARKREATGRQRRGGTLFDTGRMFDSIEATRTGKLQRTISANTPYASFHQFGTSKLPKREFIGANSDDINAITRFFIERIRRSFRG